MRCCEKLSLHDYHDEFLINMNIQNNFLSTGKQDKSELFGFEVKKSPLYHSDLLNINHVFDVCFQRDADNNPYLVISANLDPTYRLTIANEFSRIIAAETVVDCEVPM